MADSVRSCAIVPMFVLSLGTTKSLQKNLLPQNIEGKMFSALSSSSTAHILQITGGLGSNTVFEPDV